jgi:hypothetical protein
VSPPGSVAVAVTTSPALVTADNSTRNGALPGSFADPERPHPSLTFVDDHQQGGRSAGQEIRVAEIIDADRLVSCRQVGNCERDGGANRSRISRVPDGSGVHERNDVRSIQQGYYPGWLAGPWGCWRNRDRDCDGRTEVDRVGRGWWTAPSGLPVTPDQDGATGVGGNGRRSAGWNGRKSGPDYATGNAT